MSWADEQIRHNSENHKLLEKRVDRIEKSLDAFRQALDDISYTNFVIRLSALSEALNEIELERYTDDD
jgi:hypothetical protein